MGTYGLLCLIKGFVIEKLNFTQLNNNYQSFGYLKIFKKAKEEKKDILINVPKALDLNLLWKKNISSDSLFCF